MTDNPHAIRTRVRYPGLISSKAGGSFTPDEASGLVAWWDMSILAYVDTDQIAAVPDSSTGGNDLAQATAGYRPLFSTPDKNGLGTAVWDTTPDDRLTTTGVVLGTSATIALVLKLGASIPNQMILGYSGSQYAGYFLSGTQMYWDAGGYGYINHGMSASTWYVLIMKRITTTWYLYRNATSVGSVGMGGGSNTFNALGAYGPTHGYYLNGVHIGEVCLYDEALSDTDREKLRDYLNAKWAVY